MLRNCLFVCGMLCSLVMFANNNLALQKIEFPTGGVQLTQSVIKQASDIYNHLPERNFSRIHVFSKEEEHWARFDVIQLAKKRVRKIREFFIGIGCDAKNIRMDLGGIPSLILFKPRATYSVSGKINLNKIEQQCFTVHANTKSFFKTKNGNYVVFEANSFVDESEMPVSGEVSICVWEFFKQKDLIIGQVSTGDENKVLETASTFYIQGFKGDQRIKLSVGGNYKIYLHRPKNANGYKAYYGQVINGNLNWTEDKRSYAYTSMFDEGELMELEVKNSFKVRDPGKTEEKNLEQRLLLTGKKLGWINCDRVVSVDKPSELKVVLEGVSDEFTTRMVLTKRNAVIPGLASSNYVNQYKFQKVPGGESAHVIAYKEQGDGYLLAYSQVTLGFIKSINLSPEYKTKEEFETFLESFLK